MRGPAKPSRAVVSIGRQQGTVLSVSLGFSRTSQAIPPGQAGEAASLEPPALYNQNQNLMVPLASPEGFQRQTSQAGFWGEDLATEGQAGLALYHPPLNPTSSPCPVFHRLLELQSSLCIPPQSSGPEGSLLSTALLTALTTLSPSDAGLGQAPQRTCKAFTTCSA